MGGEIIDVYHTLSSRVVVFDNQLGASPKRVEVNSVKSGVKMMSRNQKVIIACLESVILSLILVGVLSGTTIRHIIQIAPITCALITVRRKSIWGVYAAFPIFVFWLFIMTLIWLFLLGIASLVRGHFTVVEIILTLLIGASSLLGIVAITRDRPHVKFKVSLFVFVLFSALQVIALWISLKRPFVNI